jgi:hypothetical protein
MIDALTRMEPVRPPSGAPTGSDQDVVDLVGVWSARSPTIVTVPRRQASVRDHAVTDTGCSFSRWPAPTLLIRGSMGLSARRMSP